MTRGEIVALAERVEAATGPDHELDCEIALAAGWERDGYNRGGRFHAQWKAPGPNGYWSARTPDSFTASLDTALTLVDEGCGVRIDRYWITDGPRWAASLAFGGVPENPRRVYEVWDAHTPALALTAAALRARAHPEETT